MVLWITFFKAIFQQYGHEFPYGSRDAENNPHKSENPTTCKRYRQKFVEFLPPASYPEAVLATKRIWGEVRQKGADGAAE